MRKIILSITALFAVSVVFAQEGDAVGGFSDGDILIGGGIMYNSEKNGNTTTNSFGVIPMVSYFFTENIAVGLTVGYESTKVKTGNSSVDSSLFLVGGHGRYYFTPASRFSLFGELGVAYSTLDLDGAKINAIGVNLTPGINFFLNEHFMLMASLGGLEYSSAKPDYSGAEATTNVGFELKIGKVDVGLAYKF